MADTETKARGLGWVPKEEFRGAEDRWVDAETFVKRGEEIMPLLRANNGRLQGEVDGLRSELSETRAALKESADAIAALKEHQTEATLNAVKETKSRLRGALRAAREAQDWDAVDELEEQMDSVKETQAAIERKPAAPPPPAAATPPAPPKEDPTFAAWKKENPWFGSDKRRTAMMFAISQELREDPDNKDLKGMPFYEKASELADEALGRKAPATKVETSTGNGTPETPRGGAAKKGYASLPKDAKDACEHQAARLVGPNRAFKKLEDWQKHYAEQYWAYEA